MFKKSSLTHLLTGALSLTLLSGCSKVIYQGKIDGAEVKYVESDPDIGNFLRVTREGVTTEFRSDIEPRINDTNYTNANLSYITLIKNGSVVETYRSSQISGSGMLGEKTRRFFSTGTSQYTSWRTKIREELIKGHDTNLKSLEETR